jgi:hypothetical protein
MVLRRNREPPVGAHTWLSCSARAGIMVNSCDPLRDYTDVLSFVDTLRMIAAFCLNMSRYSIQIYLHYLVKSHLMNFASISSLGVTCFSTLKYPCSNLGTRFFLRGEGCDTPGVSFVLWREINPNLGCWVKISLSRSRMSLIIQVIPSHFAEFGIIQSHRRPIFGACWNFYFSERMQTRKSFSHFKSHLKLI